MRRVSARTGLACALLTLGAISCCHADIVQQILAHVPAQAYSYAQVATELSSLDSSSDRVSVVRLGRSHGGRDILCAAVHDPQTIFGQTRCLFIIGRLHGNEPSGTSACMALIRHFATAGGAVERETLRRLTLVFVPMSNPDGADSGRRSNAKGVDLNRDWQSRSQPETQAIDRAVKVWQPDALMDLHELPASSSKPSYRENFVETIGRGPGITSMCSTVSAGASYDIARWMRAYGYRFNIYYDGPGKDRRLCHRRFGLDLGIPSFLMEAKTGAGRDIRYRCGFHVVGALTVANYLICGAGLPGAPQMAATEGPADNLAAESRPSAGRTSRVELRLVQAMEALEGESEAVEAVVSGSQPVRYVKFYLDGRLWLVTNNEPYQCPMDPADVGEGAHQVDVTVIGETGEVLASATGRVNIGPVQAAGR